MAARLRSLCIIFFGLAGTASFAQSDVPPVINMKLAHPTVAANKTFIATLTVKIGDGLHCYQNPPSDPSLIPLSLKLADKTFKLVTVSYPKGTPTKVEGEPKPINIYSGTITVPITLKAPAKPGATTLNVEVEYQQCNAQSCFQPHRVIAKASLTVLTKSALAKNSKTSR